MQNDDYRPEDVNYAERVQKGIALLDEQWADWWKEIDTDRLDISSGSSCMTAQAAQFHQGPGANWRDGMALFGLTEGNWGTYIEHGFNVDSSWNSEAATYREGWEEWTSEDADMAFSELNRLWRTEILKRREAAKSE